MGLFMDQIMFGLVFMVSAPAMVAGFSHNHFNSDSFNRGGSRGVKPGLQKMAAMLWGCPGLDPGDVNITCHHEKFEKRFGTGLDCTSNVPIKTKATFLGCPTGYGIVEEYTIISCKFPGRWDNDVFTCDETSSVATTTIKSNGTTTKKLNTTVTTKKLNTTTTKPLNGTTKPSNLTTKPLVTTLPTLLAGSNATVGGSGNLATSVTSGLATSTSAPATQATTIVPTNPAGATSTAPASSASASATQATTVATAPGATAPTETTTAAPTTTAATNAATTTAAPTTAPATTAATTTAAATTSAPTTAAPTTAATTTAAPTTAAAPIAGEHTAAAANPATTASSTDTSAVAPTTAATSGDAAPTTTVAGPTTTGSACLPSGGFDKCFGDKIYRVVRLDLSWEDANTSCVKDGAKLPVIETQAELDFIMSINTGDHMYMGYNDKATEGTFLTVDGAPVPQLLPIQIVSPMKKETNDCVKYGPTSNPYSSLIGMLDIPCDNKLQRHIVCEKPK